MTHVFSIPEASMEDWMKELKPYQQNIIATLLVSENQDVEKVAEKWLTATGSTNITPFGGIKDLKSFWDNFKNEFNRFLCDDTAYVAEKNELSSQSSYSHVIFLSLMSSGLAKTLGVSASFLAPAAVLLLYSAGKMGRKAYCKTYFSKITERNNEQ